MEYPSLSFLICMNLVPMYISFPNESSIAEIILLNKGTKFSNF